MCFSWLNIALECISTLHHIALLATIVVMMTKVQIIGAIMLYGKYVEQVAKDNNSTKRTFYRVIRGESPNSPIRGVIASIINKPENEIWPNSKKGNGPASYYRS